MTNEALPSDTPICDEGKIKIIASLRVLLPPSFLDMPGEPTIKWPQGISQLVAFFFLTDSNLAEDKRLTQCQKVTYVRSLLGDEGMRIGAAHPISNKWDIITYDEFKKELKSFLERPKNPVRAEFDLRQKMQGINETVSDYVTVLRTLMADYYIQDNIYENRQLAMQLVIDCRAKLTQEKLLAEQTIDLDKFLTVMRADESAAAIRQENTIASSIQRQVGQHKK